MKKQMDLGDGVKVTRSGFSEYLNITPDTRDAIVSANTFLVMLYDRVESAETKIRIGRVITHLSNMIYGFEDEQE